MGISGFTGAAAAGAVDDLIVQTLAQRRFEEQMRAQQAQEQIQREQMAATERQRTAQIEEMQRTRRDAANARGVAEMNQQAQIMAQQEQQQAEQAAAAEQASGLDALANDPALPPSVRRMIALQRRGVRGVNADALLSPEERRADEDADVRKAARIADAQAGAAAKYREPKDKPDQAAGPSPYATERGARILEAVDAVLPLVNRWTAGGGSVLAAVPASDARYLKAQLDTLKGNIAFNELAQMREASKTGGALGAISERELDLLQSTLGAIDQGLSPAQLRNELQKIKGSVEKWRSIMSGTAPMASHGGGAAPAPRRLRFDRNGNPIQE